MKVLSQQKFKTSWFLWAALALALFLPICLIHWLPKEDSLFDGFVACIRSRLYDQAWGVLLTCLFFGLPAIALGWVLQALVVVGIRMARSRLAAQSGRQED